MSVQHMMVMEDMLKDFLLGEHLLLVGNQVGNTWSLLALLHLSSTPSGQVCFDVSKRLHVFN